MGQANLTSDFPVKPTNVCNSLQNDVKTLVNLDILTTSMKKLTCVIQHASKRLDLGFDQGDLQSKRFRLLMQHFESQPQDIK